MHKIYIYLNKVYSYKIIKPFSMLTVTEMLVNVLNICSDDELVVGDDSSLEEGKYEDEISFYYSSLLAFLQK